MMAPLARLIADWTLRRDRLRAHATEDPRLAWISRLRIRVLSFLLARYTPLAASGPDDPAAPPPAPAVEPPPICFVDDPALHPPRPCEAMAPRLREIARCNARSRPRWRLF
ncbi:MAG: hypothetical protein WD749_03095 [Phycisphaerales bacterium]